MYQFCSAHILQNLLQKLLSQDRKETTENTEDRKNGHLRIQCLKLVHVFN